MPCSLWDIAIEERKVSEKVAQHDNTDSAIASEAHLFVCGGKECGKTTLVQRLLERAEPPKPTVGLDFIFGRKSKSNNLVKDVAHIWELGGGTSMLGLVDTVITTSNIRNISIALVLDLSQPKKLWETQHSLLSQVKNRVDEVVRQVSKSDAKVIAELKLKAANRIGVEHPDSNRIEASLIPIAIIGTKFDVYQEMEQEEKNMISKTLRYIAHSNGAMLHFSALKSDGLLNRVKSMLSHLAFGTSLNPLSSLEPSKPCIVPFGADSFEKNGPPPLSNEQLLRLSKGGSPYQLWMAAYATVFPSEKNKENSVSNPSNDSQFAEEIVDLLRKQKDNELEKYRKLSERKAKEAEINVVNSKKVK